MLQIRDDGFFTFAAASGRLKQTKTKLHSRCRVFSAFSSKVFRGGVAEDA